MGREENSREMKAREADGAGRVRREVL